MCGILGGNIKGWNYEKGIEAIRHRGPDAQQVKNYSMCTLAFARLSIMDLSMNAMQPMESIDGTVSMVFNGEIYGFNKLKNYLKGKREFYTESDTEVILNAYMEYGNRFVDYIDGMFAIVIYDKREQVLKLFRDRYGIKPLYYYYNTNGDFAFASEIKAILAASEGKRWEINETAVYDFLCYQYVPEPKSIYKKIHKLEPANYIIYDLQKNEITTKERYWHLHVNTNAVGRKRKEEVLEEVKRLIEKSVKQQMVADVNIGTFLSGGIDSSIITYECSRADSAIEAYSIGFHDAKYDESKYSKIFVEKYQINQKLKYVLPKDIKDSRGLLKSMYDEPFADTSAYPTYIVSKFARENVKVVLTGDAGDEVFGGYERYQAFGDIVNNSKQINVIEKFTREKIKAVLSNMKAFRKVCFSDLDIYAQFVIFNDKTMHIQWKNELGIDRSYDTLWYLKKYWVEDLPPLTRMRYLDFKTYLPSDNLTKVDRASMSASLEARIPFLNRELVEFVFSLPESEVCEFGGLKKILKECYDEIIPKEILYRKKKGFSIPDTYFRISSQSETKYMKILKNDWMDIWQQARK